MKRRKDDKIFTFNKEAVEYEERELGFGYRKIIQNIVVNILSVNNHVMNRDDKNSTQKRYFESDNDKIELWRISLIL